MYSIKNWGSPKMVGVPFGFYSNQAERVPSTKAHPDIPFGDEPIGSATQEFDAPMRKRVGESRRSVGLLFASAVFYGDTRG